MADHTNLSYLYSLADGDMDFVTEILDLMQKNIPVDIADIENAIAMNDIQLVQRMAHRMKSTIQYSDYLDLSELLSVFEKDNSGITIAELKTFLPELKELAENLMSLIEVEKKKIGK